MQGSWYAGILFICSVLGVGMCNVGSRADLVFCSFPFWGKYVSVTPGGAVFASIAEAVLAHDISWRCTSLSCPSWAKIGSVCAL